MGNSKVQLANGTVLIDLTADTVSAETLKQGITAHDKAGNAIVGTMSGGGGDATEPYIEETYNASGNLTNAVLHGYTKIRQFLFYGCSNLALTELPSGITDIGNSAFYACSSLALTELPSDITNIGESALRNCSSLALTELPSGITKINNYVFYGCSSLALTELPSGITSIGASSFYNCTSLVLTKLPSTINDVNSSAFYNCTSLVNMEIDCQKLGSGYTIFNGCTGLEKVWFRNTCTTVTAATAKNAPFVGCQTSLQIYVEASSKPSGYGTYFNRTGSNGGTTVTVVYGQTTRPW